MGQETKELYRELMQALADGHEAFVETVCAPNGGVTKRVLTGPDESGMQEMQNGQEAAKRRCITETPLGPVSHAFSEDGVLTVVERYLPMPRLFILGGGHIALALTQMAKACEFYTIVYDDRPMFANRERFPAANEVICDSFSRLFERVQIKPADYVVIVTRGHKHDQECLEGVLTGERPAYTGMIGSRRRVAIVMKQLKDAGYAPERLDEVYSPIGLRIGAVTPAEIAVSILAELIEVKRVKRAETGGISCDLETASALAEHGKGVDALFTILETHGSVPRETGAKMGMSYEGSIIGTIGGGCAESGIMQDARTVIRDGGWKTVGVDMTDTAEEDGMVCGGNMTVLIERA